MRDIKLLCVVLVVGGLMGAVASREADKGKTIVVRQLVWADSDSGGGIGVLLTDKDKIKITLSAINNVATTLAVNDNESMLTMTDSNKRIRLVMGVGSKGNTTLNIRDSKGKIIWGVYADENGKVITIGH